MDNVPWELFEERFHAKYLPEYFQEQQARAFHTLVHGNKTVEEYEIKVYGACEIHSLLRF